MVVKVVCFGPYYVNVPKVICVLYHGNVSYFIILLFQQLTIVLMRLITVMIMQIVPTLDQEPLAVNAMMVIWETVLSVNVRNVQLQ